MRIERADLMIDPAKAYIANVVEYIERGESTGERVFVYGNAAYYYFLADRYYPWPFVQVYPGMVGGEHGMGLASALVDRPPALIVKGTLAWPGMPAVPSYAQALNAFVERGYRPYEGFFDVESLPVDEAPPSWAIEIRVPGGDPGRR